MSWIKELLNKFEFESILNSWFASLLSWLTIIIFGLVFSPKRKLFPWLYRISGRKLVTFIKYLIWVITSPMLRIFLILLFLIFVSIKINYFYSVLIFLLALSLLWRPKKELFFNPPPFFSDDFSKKGTFSKDWKRVTGSPEPDETFGKPAPDLELKYIESQATNSFVLLRNINKEEGIIECDVNIETHGLLNIVFLCDQDNSNWYMARYDTRVGFSDGFLVKDGGPGNNWREFVMSGTRTHPRKWFRARVEFDEHRAKMFKDGELIAELDHPQRFGTRIGLFNEVNDVHIDNFSIIKK